MNLSEKLTRLRKREGLSQFDLAEKLQVSRQAISRWEVGTARPSMENLQVLSKLYQVPLDVLLEEDDEERLPPASEDSEAPQEAQESAFSTRKKPWLKRLFITAIVLLLTVYCSFLYLRSQEAHELDLDKIQQEEVGTQKVPEFDMNWD